MNFLYHTLNVLKHNLRSSINITRNSIHNISSKKLSDQHNNGFRIFLLLLILSFSAVFSWIVKDFSVNAKVIQEGIADEIVRFHVIANSDTEEDQALKYKVRDTLVTELAPILETTENIKEAKTQLNNRLIEIKETAEAVIRSNGYDYRVTVTLEPWYFPLRVYGEYSFPPGTYDALRVKIGEASGENWWCVMFPPLCFVDETYSVVNGKSEKQLKHVLTEKEYNTLRNKKTPVKIKFKLIEKLIKLFD